MGFIPKESAKQTADRITQGGYSTMPPIGYIPEGWEAANMATWVRRAHEPSATKTKQQSC